MQWASNKTEGGGGGVGIFESPPSGRKVPPSGSVAPSVMCLKQSLAGGEEHVVQQGCPRRTEQVAVRERGPHCMKLGSA